MSLTITITLIIAGVFLVVVTLFSTVMQFLLTKHVRITGWKVVKKPLVITAISNIFLAILTWICTATATIVWAVHAWNGWIAALAGVVSLVAIFFIVIIGVDASETFDALKTKEKPMNLSDVVEQAVNS